MSRNSCPQRSAFSKRVAMACDAIPAGRVASYGQLALLCGNPRAARQVGQALGRGVSGNAHRVVNHAGALSGASAFLVAGMQENLLRAEGVEVSAAGRVEFNRFGWCPSEEEVSKLQAAFSRIESDENKV